MHSCESCSRVLVEEGFQEGRESFVEAGSFRGLAGGQALTRENLLPYGKLVDLTVKTVSRPVCSSFLPARRRRPSRDLQHRCLGGSPEPAIQLLLISVTSQTWSAARV